MPITQTSEELDLGRQDSDKINSENRVAIVL